MSVITNNCIIYILYYIILYYIILYYIVYILYIYEFINVWTIFIVREIRTMTLSMKLSKIHRGEAPNFGGKSWDFCPKILENQWRINGNRWVQPWKIDGKSMEIALPNVVTFMIFIQVMRRGRGWQGHDMMIAWSPVSVRLPKWSDWPCWVSVRPHNEHVLESQRKNVSRSRDALALFWPL